MIIKPIIPAQAKGTAQAPVRSTIGRGAEIADIYIRDRWADWKMSVQMAASEMEREQKSYEQRAKFIQDEIKNVQNNIVNLSKVQASDKAALTKALLEAEKLAVSAKKTEITEAGKAARAKASAMDRRAEQEALASRKALEEEGRLQRAGSGGGRPATYKASDLTKLDVTDALQKGTLDKRVSAVAALKLVDSTDKKFAYDAIVQKEIDDNLNAGLSYPEAARDAIDKVRGALKLPSEQNLFDAVVKERRFLRSEDEEKPRKEVPVYEPIYDESLTYFGGGKIQFDKKFLEELKQKDPAAAAELLQAQDRLNKLYEQQAALKAPTLGSERERARGIYAKEILGKSPEAIADRGASSKLLDFISKLNPEDREKLLNQIRESQQPAVEQPAIEEELTVEQPVIEEEFTVEQPAIEEQLTVEEANEILRQERKDPSVFDPAQRESLPELARQRLDKQRADRLVPGAYEGVIDFPDTEEGRRALSMAPQYQMNIPLTEEDRTQPPLMTQVADELQRPTSMIQAAKAAQTTQRIPPNVAEAYTQSGQEELPVLNLDETMGIEPITPIKNKDKTDELIKLERGRMPKPVQLPSPDKIELGYISKYYLEAKKSISEPKLFKEMFDSEIGKKALVMYDFYSGSIEAERPTKEQLAFIKNELTRGLAFNSKEYQNALRSYAALLVAIESGWTRKNFEVNKIIE